MRLGQPERLFSSSASHSSALNLVSAANFLSVIPLRSRAARRTGPKVSFSSRTSVPEAKSLPTKSPAKPALLEHVLQKSHHASTRNYNTDDMDTHNRLPI